MHGVTMKSLNITRLHRPAPQGELVAHCVKVRNGFQIVIVKLVPEETAQANRTFFAVGFDVFGAQQGTARLTFGRTLERLTDHCLIELETETLTHRQSKFARLWSQ